MDGVELAPSGSKMNPLALSAAMLSGIGKQSASRLGPISLLAQFTSARGFSQLPKANTAAGVMFGPGQPEGLNC